jgi:hypothetical protein
MSRIFLVWLILASGIGWGVYQVKYEVQRLESKLVRLNRGIVSDQEMIQVLNAEWSHLNQPQQLEERSRRHLELEPMTGKQFTTIEQIPMRGAAHAASAPKPGKPGLAAAPQPALPPAPSQMPPPAPPGLEEDDPPTAMPMEEPFTPVAATRSTPAPIARATINAGAPTPPAPRGATPLPPPLPARAAQPTGVTR